MGEFLRKLLSLLHLGRIPGDVRSKLESEARILYEAQSIWETATFRNFKAPGVRSLYRCTGSVGFFVVTEKRIVARAGFFNRIDVNSAYDEPLFQKVVLTVLPGVLSLAFDASAQSPRMSGSIEVRLHLPDVDAAADVLERAGARVERRNGSLRQGAAPRVGK